MTLGSSKESGRVGEGDKERISLFPSENVWKLIVTEAEKIVAKGF
jgi:hypothetical protein